MVRWSREEWEQEGRLAILDVLDEKHVCPWTEIIERISNAGRKDFRKVQPLQLEGAKRQLRADKVIVSEASNHSNPVITYRRVDHGLTDRQMERERGRRRAVYRTYMAWAGDPAACGRHAEKVVLSSMQKAAGPGQFVVPAQRVGHIPAVLGLSVEPGPLDALALMPNVKDPVPPVALVVEVKNVNDWIYPWDRRLWELLVKAAGLAKEILVYPILACPQADFMSFRMGEDLGFARGATPDSCSATIRTRLIRTPSKR